MYVFSVINSILSLRMFFVCLKRNVFVFIGLSPDIDGPSSGLFFFPFGELADGWPRVQVNARHAVFHISSNWWREEKKSICYSSGLLTSWQRSIWFMRCVRVRWRCFQFISISFCCIVHSIDGNESVLFDDIPFRLNRFHSVRRRISPSFTVIKNNVGFVCFEYYIDFIRLLVSTTMLLSSHVVMQEA